jgi:hypothetical protein
MHLNVSILKNIIIVAGLFMLMIIPKYILSQEVAGLENRENFKSDEILINDLSEKQQADILALKLKTDNRLIDLYRVLDRLNEQLKDKIIHNETTNALKDSIDLVNSEILDLKINYNVSVRSLLTEKQQKVFDKQFTSGTKDLTQSNVPVFDVLAPQQLSYFKHKNHLKLNVAAIPLKNYSLFYERQLSMHWTIGASVTLMPQTQTPFVESLNNFIMGYDQTEEEIIRGVNNPLLNMKSSGYRFAIRGRYYFNPLKSPSSNIVSSFYLGSQLFYSYYNHSSSFKGEFEGDQFKADVLLEQNNFGGAISIGNLWIINDRFTIDLNIFGMSFKGVNNSGILKTDSQIDFAGYIEEIFNVNLPEWQYDEINDTGNLEATFNGSSFSRGMFLALWLGFKF